MCDLRKSALSLIKSYWTVKKNLAYIVIDKNTNQYIYIIKKHRLLLLKIIRFYGQTYSILMIISDAPKTY